MRLGSGAPAGAASTTVTVASARVQANSRAVMSIADLRAAMIVNPYFLETGLRGEAPKSCVIGVQLRPAVSGQRVARLRSRHCERGDFQSTRRVEHGQRHTRAVRGYLPCALELKRKRDLIGYK